MVGDIANVAMALCALFTILVTISENCKIRAQTAELEERRFLSSGFETLCFEKILASWDELYDSLKKNMNLLKNASDKAEEKECYNCMTEDCNSFEIRLRYLKMYNHDLYKNCASYIEKVQDAIAKCINGEGVSDAKLRFTDYQIRKCLQHIVNYGFKIIEAMYRYGCDEIWMKKS